MDAMPLLLNIQYCSISYEIFPAQIRSKPLLEESKPQHYCSFEIHAFFLQLRRVWAKESRVRIFFTLQLIQSCADRAHYPVIFFEKCNIIARGERLSQNSTNSMKSFEIISIVENSDQLSNCVICTSPLGKSWNLKQKTNVFL